MPVQERAIACKERALCAITKWALCAITKWVLCAIAKVFVSVLLASAVKDFGLCAIGYFLNIPIASKRQYHQVRSPTDEQSSLFADAS